MKILTEYLKPIVMNLFEDGFFEQEIKNCEMDTSSRDDQNLFEMANSLSLLLFWIVSLFKTEERTKMLETVWLFLLGLGNNFSYNSSPNIWWRFEKHHYWVLTFVATFRGTFGYF